MVSACMFTISKWLAFIQNVNYYLFIVSIKCLRTGVVYCNQTWEVQEIAI